MYNTLYIVFIIYNKNGIYGKLLFHINSLSNSFKLNAILYCQFIDLPK